MHIGSSSRMPATSPDAPFIVSSTLTFQNAMGSMLDYIFSGTLERFPTLQIAYSRGPGRLDALRARAGRQAVGRAQRQQLRHVAAQPADAATSRAGSTAASSTTRPGSGTATRIGIDQICFETDYPHADSTFPHSKEVATEICAKAGLDEEETYKLVRGNAIRAFGLDRFGITA